MNLRLNRSHPLCQPSRNLVFATFGTGLGGQVLDLADRPSHGVMSHASTSPSIIRTISSDVPGGFPADYAALSMRSANYSRVEFANHEKVSALTNDFSVSCWVRPWNSTITIGPRTTTNNNNGWLLVPTYTGSPFITGAWILNAYNGDIVNSWGTNSVIPVGQWSLISWSWSSSAGSVTFRPYTNGSAVGIHYTPTQDSITTASEWTFGEITNYPPYCDIGPTMVWGSILSAEDMALLYRDTWGMVTRSGVGITRMMAGAGASTYFSSGNPSMVGITRRRR